MEGQATTVSHLPGRDDYSKVYHVVFYGGWCALAWLSLRHLTKLAAVGVTMLAGAGDELHQYSLPFRESRVSDVLLDTAAVLGDGGGNADLAAARGLARKSSGQRQAQQINEAQGKASADRRRSSWFSATSA